VASTEPQGTGKTSEPKRRTMVVDTSVVYLSPQPWDAPELAGLDNIDYVIPTTVLSELDRLVQRRETRKNAQAAMHVLQRLVDSGAAEGGVGCGRGSTLRVASSDEESPQPGLDMGYADDRILALCVGLKDQGSDVTLATTEFALYAKARAWGVRGELIATPEPPSVGGALLNREKELFWASWRRVSEADSPTQAYRRAYQFLRQRLVQRLLGDAVRIGHPTNVLSAYNKFLRFPESAGLTGLGVAFGPPGPLPRVNLSTELVIEYSDVYSTPRTRSETAAERALRLQHEQAALHEYEVSIVEEIRSSIQIIGDYVMDRLGDDLA